MRSSSFQQEKRFSARLNTPTHRVVHAWFSLILVFLTGTGLSLPVRADSVAKLSALKAAYTFHFLNLVRWARPDTQLAFCVFGESEAGDRMLSTLDGRTVHAQTILARHVSVRAKPPARCDALYIPAAYQENVSTLLKRYEDTATLTISDAGGFVNAGGVIAFVAIDDRLRFDVNQRSASKKGLKLSAKLLELAREVHR